MKNIAYITTFDKRYLLYGLSLYSSLKAAVCNSQFSLHIICIDEFTFHHLQILNLDNIYLYRLKDIQDDKLLVAKSNRSHVEFCWTLASFSLNWAILNLPFDNIVYLDSDLYINNDPAILFDDDFDILITPHDFDIDNHHLIEYGKYCVQLIALRRNKGSAKVIEDWYHKVLDWCYCKVEPERFGDQKYLDRWIDLYPDVSIQETNGLTIGPWNVNKYIGNLNSIISYHFHSSKIIFQFFIPYDGYKIDQLKIFQKYCKHLNFNKNLLNKYSIKIYYKNYTVRNILGIIKRFLLGKIFLYKI